ncbi:MAG TPA: magnesium transporter CorA family protein [Candidatus Saccharimonadales bacterium]|nr:magnesium transporter CorA family protein [Candidatus Saccharimonadales bacterium]
MIKYIYKSLRKPAVEELNEYRRGCWVYVETPDHNEINELVKKFNLNPGHIEDALDEDEMPRLEKEDSRSYIFVRFAYRAEDGELQTVPLLFIFDEEILITVSLVRMPSLELFLTGHVDFNTTQRTRLVLQILGLISDKYDYYIADTSKMIKAIRARLRGHAISNQDFVDFVTIEDELNEFLASLLPTNATLRRLLLGRYMPLFEEDQDIVEDLLLNNEQSIEACNSNMKSIANIRDAYTSISSNNLNRTIKVLTIATVMIAIPNLFYSMYGMNVPLPWQHEPWAYGAIMLFTISLVLAVAIFGRRKKIF